MCPHTADASLWGAFLTPPAGTISFVRTFYIPGSRELAHSYRQNCTPGLRNGLEKAGSSPGCVRTMAGIKGRQVSVLVTSRLSYHPALASSFPHCLSPLCSGYRAWLDSINVFRRHAPLGCMSRGYVLLAQSPVLSLILVDT